MNKLITFEGIDGVGKTTQIDLFLEKLRNAKYYIHYCYICNDFWYCLFFICKKIPRKKIKILFIQKQ